MKKILSLALILIISATYAFCQKVILKEDFEVTPSGFKTFNLDGLPDDCGTPGEFSKGWLLSTPMGFSGGQGKYAKDCSDHGTNLTSKADDWIISRGVKVGSSSIMVSWVNFSEWDQNIMVYASKKFNGTTSDLSKFTLITTVMNNAWVFNTHNAGLNNLGLIPGDSLYVAFRNNVAHKGQLYMDNLEIKEVKSRDAEVKTYDSRLYASTTSLPLSGKVYSNGASPVTSYTLNWKINGGAISSQTFSGLNINSGKYHFFQITGNVNYSAGENVLKVFITNVNGQGADEDITNDTLTEHIYIVTSPTVVKNVLIEDYTGAWCGNCVDAIAVSDSLSKNNPKCIITAMHVQDVMTVSQSTELGKKYNISAYPTMVFDRKSIDPNSDTPGVLGNGWPCNIWRTTAAACLSDISPVDVSVNYFINTSTRLLAATVSANFKDAGAFGDLRIHCYIVENSVTGPSPSYDQHNYRNTIPGHPFFGKGEPIKGFAHQHVFRNEPGGIDGTAGIIPKLVNKGQTFQKQYTYTLPPGWNINNIKVIGFVSRYSENNLYNQVYNVTESGTSTEIAETDITSDGITVYPNPAGEKINLMIKGSEKLLIYNSLAQQVWSGNFNDKNGSVLSVNTSDFPSGIYFLVINSDSKTITKKIVINHPSY